MTLARSTTTVASWSTAARGDLIITGGENVWPDPVEARLAAHPAVADVAVAGRDDPEWGQRVVAFVVPRPGARRRRLDGATGLGKEQLPASLRSP